MRQFAMVWLIPLVSVVCCGIFWFVLFRRKWSFDGFTASIMVLFYTFFPSIVTRVALTSSCSQYGSKSLLSEALSVKCWSESHWVVIFTVGLPGFFVFVLLIPFVLARKLIHQRRAETLYYHQKLYDPKWTLRYGFIFAGYRIGFEWWESVIMLRKCCFVLLSIFLGAYGATPQCVGASMILTAALSLQLQYRPFLDDGHNRLESIGLHACLLQLLVALMSNAVGKVGHSTLGPTSTTVLVCTMFGSSLGFFWWTIRVTIQSSKEAEGVVGTLARFCGRWCGEKRKGRENPTHTNERNSTKNRTGKRLSSKKSLPILIQQVRKAVVHNKVVQIQTGHEDARLRYVNAIKERQRKAAKRLESRVKRRNLQSSSKVVPQEDTVKGEKRKKKKKKKRKKNTSDAHSCTEI
jgi:hypothetical protein